MKKRILFFGEPATLAHVVRPLVLATALDREHYAIVFATGPDFQRFPEEAGLSTRTLWAIGTRAYLRAVAAGRPVFPYRILTRYVSDDLEHIAAVQPDLIVGDFRLSLAVSARLAQVPYLAISNAYWSPWAPARFEVPVHRATRLLGPQIANAAFQKIYPLIFAWHSVPMNRLRKKYGMPTLGFDLRSIFTEADLTLFADVPELVPTRDSGLGDKRYRYIGPIVWSPAGELPAALRDADDRRPLVYIALGSSGDPRLLSTLVTAARTLDARVAVATGGQALPSALPSDVISAPWLPGDALAALAALVVCNGGSPGTHQALQQGTPVLGIPANLDQLLNMHFIVAAGAGLMLRADRVNFSRARDLMQRLLTAPEYLRQAQAAAGWLRRYFAAAGFQRAVQDMLGARP